MKLVGIKEREIISHLHHTKPNVIITPVTITEILFSLKRYVVHTNFILNANVILNHSQEDPFIVTKKNINGICVVPP